MKINKIFKAIIHQLIKLTILTTANDTKFIKQTQFFVKVFFFFVLQTETSITLF